MPSSRPSWIGPRRAIAIAMKASEIPSWIVAATRSGAPSTGCPTRDVLGDRAREQLLDRALQGRDEDEDRRPQHRDLAVLLLRELVRGDDEVEVGDQARQPDADREQAGAPPVAGGFARFVLAAIGSRQVSSGARAYATVDWLTDQSIGPDARALE